MTQAFFSKIGKRNSHFPILQLFHQSPAQTLETAWKSVVLASSEIQGVKDR